MKRTFFISLLLFVQSFVFAQSNYYLLYDYKFSPYISSQGFLLLHDSMQLVEEDIFKGLHEENRYVKLLGNLVDLFLFWQPINELMVITQKEIFGIGYMGRTLDAVDIQSYEINSPFPYGKSGGDTNFTIKATAPVQDILLMDISGINATSILANAIKINQLNQRVINGRSATFYLQAMQQLSLSANCADTPLNVLLQSNAISDYVKWLNIVYPNNDYTLKMIQNMSFLNLVDPLSFYSAFSMFQFIASRSSTKLFGFPIGNGSYLPNLRVDLAPYGPEIFLENFLTYEDQTIYFYLKANKILQYTNFGAGIVYPKVTSLSFLSLGFRLDFWKQVNPHIPYSFTQTYDKHKALEPIHIQYHNLFGAAISALVEQHVPGSPLSLFAQLGLKTKGFLEGEPFSGNPILRVGFDLTF